MPCTPYLTDDLWNLIAPIITNSPHPLPRRGRPAKHIGRPLSPDRETLEGILCVLLTRINWMDLPHPPYPSYAACFRRYTLWQKNGVWDAILTALFDHYHALTGIDLTEFWQQHNPPAAIAARRPIAMPPSRNRAESLIVALFILSMAEILSSDTRRLIPT